MSNTAMLAENLVGLFGFFIEEGETVDMQTVSSTVKPDNDPTDNWPSIGDCLPGAQFSTETTEDSYLKAMPQGGFRKQDRQWVTADYLTFQTRQMHELSHRLQMGLGSKVAPGTPQSPHMKADRFIRGWLRFQGRKLGPAGGGTDLWIFDWWCELRMIEQPAFGNQAVSPSLRALKLESPGNTVNFPI